jgi:hypothetical protein
MDAIRAPAEFTTSGTRMAWAAERTAIVLIRHAHTEAVGSWLAGRTIDVPLSTEGRRQAQRLSSALAKVALDALYSSPLARPARPPRSSVAPTSCPFASIPTSPRSISAAGQAGRLRRWRATPHG